MDFTLDIFKEGYEQESANDSENIFNMVLFDESDSGSEFDSDSYSDPDLDTGDFSKITIPGGDDETPDKDGIKLTSSQYNKALDLLQKSYKEGAEMANLLKNAMIVPDDQANDYEESLSISLCDDDE